MSETVGSYVLTKPGVPHTSSGPSRGGTVCNARGSLTVRSRSSRFVYIVSAFEHEVGLQ